MMTILYELLKTLGSIKILTILDFSEHRHFSSHLKYNLVCLITKYIFLKHTSGYLFHIHSISSPINIFDSFTLAIT